MTVSKLDSAAKAVEAALWIIGIVGTIALSAFGNELSPQVATVIAASLGTIGTWRVWLVRNEPLIATLANGVVTVNGQPLLLNGTPVMKPESSPVSAVKVTPAPSLLSGLPDMTKIAATAAKMVDIHALAADVADVLKGAVPPEVPPDDGTVVSIPPKG